MRVKNSHCSYCGYPFAVNAPWPRRCVRCGNVSYLNPLPVAVALIPVDTGHEVGLLTVRRGIEPGKGWLALPGGYIMYGESWQEAAAREAQEETSLPLDPALCGLFALHSAPDGTLLVFCLYQRMWPLADLPPFDPHHELRHETLERVVIDAPQTMAFPLHTQVVHDFFLGQRLVGPLTHGD